MDSIIYGLAYWLRGHTKSSTIIKYSLILLLVSIPFSLLVWSWVPVVAVLLFNQCVTLVLEFLYAKNEE